MDTIGEQQPVQFAAGFRLMDKFKSQWEELHNSSEMNVLKAQSVVSKINAIELKCSQQLNAVDSFKQSCQSIPKLQDQIADIQRDLSKLEQNFVKIEECLFVLAKAHRHLQ